MLVAIQAFISKLGFLRGKMFDRHVIKKVKKRDYKFFPEHFVIAYMVYE